MTYTIALRMACVVFMANAIAATAVAADLHNFVVLVPEAMQPEDMDDADTPALARVREEGVYFSRSYAGFPQFTFADQQSSAANRAAELAAISYESYTGLVVDDSSPTQANIQMLLEKLGQRKRPFILVYRCEFPPRHRPPSRDLPRTYRAKPPSSGCRRWSQWEEIGWAQFQEIRWSLSRIEHPLREADAHYWPRGHNAGQPARASISRQCEHRRTG
jgi:hypothetical protein